MGLRCARGPCGRAENPSPSGKTTRQQGGSFRARPAGRSVVAVATAELVDLPHRDPNPEGPGIVLEPGTLGVRGPHVDVENRDQRLPIPGLRRFIIAKKRQLPGSRHLDRLVVPSEGDDLAIAQLEEQGSLIRPFTGVCPLGLGLRIAAGADRLPHAGLADHPPVTVISATKPGGRSTPAYCHCGIDAWMSFSKSSARASPLDSRSKPTIKLFSMPFIRHLRWNWVLRSGFLAARRW